MSLPYQRQEISPMGGQNVDNQMVGLVDLGNSSHGKRRKQRSDVWFNFEKYRDEDGKDCAKCNLCQKLFDGSSKKGTTHLKNHFQICQKRRNGGGGGDMPAEASILTNPIAIKEKSAMDQALNHLDMARMIIKQGVTSPNSIKAADIIYVYNEEKELRESQRADAVSSMVYKASARIRDPIHCCAGAICQHQKQVNELQVQLAKAQLAKAQAELQAQLAKSQAELMKLQCQQTLLCMELAKLSYPPSPSQPQPNSPQYVDDVFPSPRSSQEDPFLDDNDDNLGSRWEPLWT